MSAGAGGETPALGVGASLPSSALDLLFRRLGLSVERGALISAINEESNALLYQPLEPRLTSLFKRLKVHNVRVALLRLDRFDPRHLPALLFFEGKWWVASGVEQAIDRDLRWSLEDGTGAVRVEDSKALALATVLWFRVPPARQEEPLGLASLGRNPAARLLFSVLFERKRWLLEIGIATVMVNVLALATSLFAMQVYDRVVPTLAYATLTTLTVGMAIVLAVDWILKMLRAKQLDAHALAVDRRLSQAVFDHVLSLRLDHRPQSLGTLSAQVSGLEVARQFFSSAAIFSLIDLPFVFLFLAMIGLLGGPVVVVYLLLLPLAIGLGWYVQRALRRLLRLQLLRSHERQGLLVDALGGAESIRSVNAGWRFSQEWDAIGESIDQYQLRQRALTNHAQLGTGTLSMAAYIGALVVGVHQIESGALTMGGLIACSILGGRVIGPVATAIRQLVQWQQVSQALQMVSGVLDIEGDRGPFRASADREGEASVIENRFLLPAAGPRQVVLEDVRFSYRDVPVTALNVPSLTFNAGDRVMLLGGVGSGKSSLLRLLSGLYQPSQGRLTFDGASLAEIDPIVLSEHVGYLPQRVHLFKGTLRSNLALSGAVSDDALLSVVQELGLDRMMQDHGRHMNLPISEGGGGVSDGQRQLIGAARILIAEPRFWLLDEPAASLDLETEQRFWAALQARIQPQDILLVSTHRPAVMREIVNRVLVLDRGCIVADGSPSAVLPTYLRPRSVAKGSGTAGATGMGHGS